MVNASKFEGVTVTSTGLLQLGATYPTNTAQPTDMVDNQHHKGCIYNGQDIHMGPNYVSNADGGESARQDWNKRCSIL